MFVTRLCVTDSIQKTCSSVVGKRCTIQCFPPSNPKMSTSSQESLSRCFSYFKCIHKKDKQFKSNNPTHPTQIHKTVDFWKQHPVLDAFPTVTVNCNTNLWLLVCCKLFCGLHATFKQARILFNDFTIVFLPLSMTRHPEH